MQGYALLRPLEPPLVRIQHQIYTEGSQQLISSKIKLIRIARSHLADGEDHPPGIFAVPLN